MLTYKEHEQGRNERGQCLSCEVLMINGVRCHERGCPDAWQDEERECRVCGFHFRPQDRRDMHCSDECYETECY